MRLLFLRERGYKVYRYVCGEVKGEVAVRVRSLTVLSLKSSMKASSMSPLSTVVSGTSSLMFLIVWLLPLIVPLKDSISSQGFVSLMSLVSVMAPSVQSLAAISSSSVPTEIEHVLASEKFTIERKAAQALLQAGTDRYHSACGA